MSRIIIRIIGVIVLAMSGAHLVLDFLLRTQPGLFHLLLEVSLTVVFAAPGLSYWGVKELWRRQGAEESMRVAAAREVEELKQDEAVLQTSREYFEAIINALGDPVFVKDRRHRFVLVNDAYCGFAGYPREKLIGKSCPDFFPKEQTDLFWVTDAQVLETGQMVINEEQLTDASGQVHTISTVKTLYTDGAGGKFIVGTIRDITARKRVEAEKAQVEAHFRQAQKMEAVGMMAGGIAHDFNNVLTTLVGYNYFVLEGLKPDDPLRPFSLEVRRAAEMAASLTRQFMAVTRKQVVRLRAMDLNAVIIETSKLFRRLLGENIKLSVEAQPSLWAIMIDSGQLEQVILNLVVNARDAMLQGGRLCIATRNVGVGEEHDGDVPPDLPPGQYVCLEVRDTGVGMDAEVQKRIFEPFFTTKDVGRGTGLGLAMVHDIAKERGGAVSVESSPGQGAAFRVFLPRAAGGVQAMMPGPVTKTTRGGDETILLVEDNGPLRALLKKTLRQKGYRVFSAANAAEGLDLAPKLKERIDLLLVDLILPDINGLELAAKLTAMRPGLKVAYMSGYAGAMLRTTNMPNDAVLIEKPFSPETLLTALRRLLDADASDTHGQASVLPGLAHE